MRKKYMVMDVEKCENCNNCFLSCKDEHCGNTWPGYSVSQPLHGHRWMNIMRKERGQFPFIDVAYLAKPCLHCEDPPCMKEANEGEIVKRPDGIVIIDPEKAKGNKELIKACPHGAIWWNEEKETPQKCTLCAHLLDEGWKAPRCAQACPTKALTFYNMEEKEFEKFSEEENLSGLHVKGGAENHGVRYKNLHRFNSCFISGSVATGKESVSECVEGATAILMRGEEWIEHVSTDAFGDFRFDNLTPESGAYQVRIDLERQPCYETTVELGESRNIGIIWI